MHKIARQKARILHIGLILILVTVSLFTACRHKEMPETRLILQITVDQLRGDMIYRFKDRFGQRGFNRLLANGIYYSNAHFQHANTFTASGHATLFTGGHAPQHGIPGNEWINRETGSNVYCCADDAHTVFGKNISRGVSPKHLISSTVGDELSRANRGKSKVFAVSFKDRGAIFPAGRLGKAFWYDPVAEGFVTSSYYFDQQPDWLDKWNRQHGAKAYRDKTWTLSESRRHYLYGDSDDRAEEKGFKFLGRSFPHKMLANHSAFARALAYTPFADRMTLALAKTLIEREQLGDDRIPDMLSVSFSSTDSIGHIYGPDSLEAEDNLLKVDETIGELLDYISREVGLENCLVILSSDHGICDIPEVAQAMGFDAVRMDITNVLSKIDADLSKQFNTTESMIAGFIKPSVYLDLGAVARSGHQPETIERAVAHALSKDPAIELAVPRTDLLRGYDSANPMFAYVQKAFHPERSGDVLLVPRQYVHLHTYPNWNASLHGSPYSYDTHVPIIFSVPGLKQKEVFRRVAPSQIPSTISLLMRTALPSGNTSEPLTEVINARSAH